MRNRLTGLLRRTNLMWPLRLVSVLLLLPWIFLVVVVERAARNVNRFARQNHDTVELLTALGIGAMTVVLAFQANLVADGTKKVAEQQSVLMDQQLQLQKFSTLPNFVVDNYFVSSIGDTTPSSMVISNSGGWARYALTQTYSFVFFNDEVAHNSFRILASFPLQGYMRVDRVDRGLNEEQIRWYYSSEYIETRYDAFISDIIDVLEHNDQFKNVVVTTNTFYEMDYVDFQGVPRTEMYGTPIFLTEGHPYLALYGEDDRKHILDSYTSVSFEDRFWIPGYSPESKEWNDAVNARASMVLDEYEKTHSSLSDSRFWSAIEAHWATTAGHPL